MVFNPGGVERSCQDFVGRLIKSDILIKNKHNLSQRGGRNASRGRREGGFPIQVMAVLFEKVQKTSLKGNIIYFCGQGLKRGTNSKTTNQLSLVISILTKLTLPNNLFS